MIRDYIWGKKLALIVVDPQRKFSLPTEDWPQRMGPAVSAMNSFMDVFRKYGAPVILIHFDGSSHTGYNGNDGDEWLPGLNTEGTDIIIHKKHMSCFKDTELESTLKKLGVDCALFAGMLTEFCVATTYFAAGERSIFPYMGKDALIPYDKEGNHAAEIMCSTVTLDTVERYLSGNQPPVVFDE